MTPVRKDVGKAILSLNDAQSLRNRRRLDELGLLAVNVLASPGAGKTSVLAPKECLFIKSSEFYASPASAQAPLAMRSNPPNPPA